MIEPQNLFGLTLILFINNYSIFTILLVELWIIRKTFFKYTFIGISYWTDKLIDNLVITIRK